MRLCHNRKKTPDTENDDDEPSLTEHSITTEQPRLFARHFAAFYAEEEITDSGGNKFTGPLAQVGPVERVGQNVIAVKTHQRVAVEEHRADAGHEKKIEHQLARETVGHQKPEPDEHGGHNQFRHDPRRCHGDTLELFRKQIRIACLHVKKRQPGHQSRARLVHFSAVMPHGNGVRTLVIDLEQDKSEIEKKQCLPRCKPTRLESTKPSGRKERNCGESHEQSRDNEEKRTKE